MDGHITTSFILSEPLVDFSPIRIQFPRLEAVLVHLLTTNQRMDEDIRTNSTNVRDMLLTVVKMEADLDDKFLAMSQQLSKLGFRCENIEDQSRVTQQSLKIAIDAQALQDANTKATSAALLKLEEHVQALSERQLQMFADLQLPGEAAACMDVALTGLIHDMDNVGKEMHTLTESVKDVRSRVEVAKVQLTANAASIAKVEQSLQVVDGELKETKRDLVNSFDRLSLQQSDTDHELMTEMAGMRAMLGDAQERLSALSRETSAPLANVAAARQPTPVCASTSMTPHSEHSQGDAFDDIRQKISDLLSVVVMVERRGRANDESVASRLKVLEERKNGRDDSPLVRRRNVFTCLSCNNEADLATQGGRAEGVVQLADMVPSGVLHRGRVTPSRPGPFTTPHGRPHPPPKPML